MSTGLVLQFVPLGLAAAVIAGVVRASRTTRPLAVLRRDGDRLTLEVTRGARWLALRSRVSAPLADVVAVRPIPAGERVRLHLRLGGTGWFGMHLGYFWRRGTGVLFVARRTRCPAVEIELRSGRVRRWIAELPEETGGLAIPA